MIRMLIFLDKSNVFSIKEIQVGKFNLFVLFLYDAEEIVSIRRYGIGFQSLLRFDTQSENYQ